VCSSLSIPAKNVLKLKRGSQIYDPTSAFTIKGSRGGHSPSYSSTRRITMRTLALLLIDAVAATALSSATAVVQDYDELDLLEEAEQEFADILEQEEKQLAPCICYNPFQGTPQEALGDSVGMCANTLYRACYVSCNSDCRDLRPARGIGRCVSRIACNPRVAFKRS
jgi:hypothetical protein